MACEVVCSLGIFSWQLIEREEFETKYGLFLGIKVLTLLSVYCTEWFVCKICYQT